MSSASGRRPENKTASCRKSPKGDSGMPVDMIIEEKKQRWNHFMNGTGDIKNIVLVNCLEGLEPKPFVKEGRYEEFSDWIMRKYEIMRGNVDRIQDDTIPFIDMLTGTEIFAEAFGCPVVYPADNQPFALPLITRCDQIPGVKTPGLWDTRLADLFEMAYRLREKAEPGTVLRLPDIQSPADIAALIMKKESFYLGLIEEPGAIRELIAKVMRLLTSFLDEWFKAFGRSFIAHYPDYYMEYGMTLSEDEIGVVSPGVFRDIFLGELNALSDRYGRIGIHCCADSRHQWDNFKKIKGLCILNICQPEPVVTEAYRFFEKTCAQMHDSWSSGTRILDPKYRNSIHKYTFPPGARVVFRLDAANHGDAQKKLEEFRRILPDIHPVA